MIEERLLACLRERANSRGIVPVHGDILIQEAKSTREEVGGALDKLERAGLVKILAPFPFLVLKLRSWSDKGTNALLAQGARKQEKKKK